jgi:hypothetical protein
MSTLARSLWDINSNFSHVVSHWKDNLGRIYLKKIKIKIDDHFELSPE